MHGNALLITADHMLIEHVRALAGAAELAVDVIEDPHRAREQWHTREQLLVGGDLCPALVGLPRRRDVSVLHWQPFVDASTPPSLWQSALALGAEHVVALPEGDGWLAELLTNDGNEPSATGQLLAIAGACGGAGASTLATGLAIAAARQDARVLLIDGDFFGGGLDLLLGAESVTGLRWPELADVSGRLSPHSLIPSLPAAHGVVLVSSGRQAVARPSLAAWQSMLAFGQHFDLTIVDLGRDLAAQPQLWWPDATGPQLWCVVPSRIRAIAAAAACLEHWRDRWEGVDVIARQCDRGISAADLGRVLGRSVRGSLPDDPSVQTAAELGEEIGGSFAKACASLVQELLV